MHELGSLFLYVDGSCNYWLNAGWMGDDPFADFREIRTGALSPSEERQLADAIQYGSPSSPIRSCPPSTPTQDAPQISIFDGASTSLCWPDAEAVREPQQFWFAQLPGLYDRGQPVSGGLRVEVSPEQEVPPGLPVYAWPLVEDIGSFVPPTSEYQTPGVSKRVESKDAIDELLRLRTQFVQDWETLGVVPGGIPIVGNYGVFLREDLPFTDDTGLFVPPG